MIEPLATFDLFGERVRPAAEAVLKRRFVFPPFSVLNAREGDWQERKRAWLLTGIRSELGRGAELLPTGANSAYGGNGFAGQRGPSGAPGGSPRPALGDYQKGRRGDIFGIESLVYAPPPASAPPYRASEQITEKGLTFGAGLPAATSTSIFDPVLCELAYRWFSPLGGVVLDPFAGGSVRGAVASHLGRRYIGIDLSPAQVAANREQLDICGVPLPEWICADSRGIAGMGLPRADFVFSCPPYADLERYSDDPADLSTLDYSAFMAAYSAIVGACARQLADDAFACFVVGDVRGRDGNYYGFVPDTVRAFAAAGMPLYNEAILVTSVGSLPVRINAQFQSGRKLGKTHQNILVFLKGNAKRAAGKLEKLGQEFTGAVE